MLAKLNNWFAGTFFTILGAAFVISCLITVFNEMSIRSKGIESVAIITNIETYGSGDDTEYKVYVQYAVNNEIYHQTLNRWTVDMFIGNEINIVYNPDNPSEVISGDFDYLTPIVGLLLGGIAFVAGISTIAKNIKKKSAKPKEMNSMRKKVSSTKFSEWASAILFMIVGAVFAVVGAALFTGTISFQSESIESVAVITKIEQYTELGVDGEFETFYDVYVQYEVDNETYNQILGSWNAGMRVGEEVKINYNPNNPSEITSAGFPYFELVFLLMGVLAFVVGMSMMAKKIKNRGKKSKFLKEGNYVDAEIEEIIYDTSYSMNGESPYIITCKWENPADGNIYRFKSDRIWGNPAAVIEEKGITTLRVYLNVDNPQEYFVSTENLNREGYLL